MKGSAGVKWGQTLPDGTLGAGRPRGHCRHSCPPVSVGPSGAWTHWEVSDQGEPWACLSQPEEQGSSWRWRLKQQETREEGSS